MKEQKSENLAPKRRTRKEKRENETQKQPTADAVLAVSDHITSFRLLVSSDKEYEKHMHTSKDKTREKRV
jgi:hypothetical protein